MPRLTARVLASFLPVALALSPWGVGLAVAQEAPVTVAQGSAVVRVADALADPAFLKITAGIHVVRVRDGETMLDWQAGRPLLPASTCKVITSAAALDALGPSYSFTTSIYRTGDVIDGVVDGDLVIVGHGDPTMVAEKLWRLLRDLRADGIASVSGDLVFDDGFFDGPAAIQGWDEPRDLAEGPSYFPAIGAFGLEFGAVTLVLRPATEVGAPGTLSLETPTARYVDLDNQLVTGAEKSRARIEIEREVVGDRLVFHVSGSLPVGGDARRFRRALTDPTAYAMGVVEELLRSVGPTVRGSIRRGTLPAGAKLVERLMSPPLASILMDTNKYSSNYMAETVLRTLGAEVRGEGTTDAGLAVVRAYLARLGLQGDEAVVANGSGLSRDTRLSARALTTVLRAAATDPMIAPELVASLSIGGRDGTLADRFGDAPGRVRGKTGTLAGVHALAGYFDADDGEQYAFAMVANDVRGGLTPVKAWMDGVLVRLLALGDDHTGDTP